MSIENILGDYHGFFQTILDELALLGVSVKGYPVSHLGIRTETSQEFEVVREKLKIFCDSFVENEHNQRPISKLNLSKPLQLPSHFTVRFPSNHHLWW